MADKYWVGGGDGLWSATAGLKWAAVSGGAGGQTVPTASDDVYLDANSPACTISANAAARKLDCTGYTNTLTHNAVSLSLGTSTASTGNIALKLVSGMTYTITAVSTSTILFVGTVTTTQTVDFGGKTTGNLTFSGSTGRWQFSSNWTATTATITYSSSSTAILDINGKTLSFSTFTGTTGATKTLTLGAAAITLASSWQYQGTVTANTATVTQSGAAPSFDNNTSAGANYNGMTLAQTGSGQAIVGTTSGANAAAIQFGTYTRTGTAVKTDSLTFTSGQTTTIGTLNLGGNTTQGVNRLLVSSQNVATAAVLSVTTAVVITGDVDFMDITINGSPSWTNSGSKWIGDAGGNSSLITTNRTTPSTRYKIVGGSWSVSTQWSASSGGSTDNRVPLPQDNVVIDGNSGNGTHTLDMPRSGTDHTWVASNTGTLSVTTNASIYGSITFISGITLSGTSALVLMGRGSHTITSAGKTLTMPLQFGLNLQGDIGGTYTLQDDITINRNSTAILLYSGTLDTNGKTVNLTGASGALQMRTPGRLTAGASTFNMGATSATTFWDIQGGTLSMTSSTIVLSTAAVTSRTFTGFGATYGTLRYTVADSPGALIIQNNNTFGMLEIGPEHRVSLTAGSTQFLTDDSMVGVFNGYHRMMGAGAGSVTLPDSAALSLTGDMDFRALVALDDWSPATTATLIAKRASATATTTSYEFYIDVNGTPSLRISNGTTTTAQNASNLSLGGQANGAKLWVRVTRRNSDGQLKAFTASGSVVNPTSSDWTQLGLAQTNAQAGQDTADPVFIGGYGSAATNSPTQQVIGKYYRAQIRNNVLDDGTGIVADVDFTQSSTFGVNSFTESSSNAATVTIFDLAQMGDGRIHMFSSSGGTKVNLSKSWRDDYGNYWWPVGTIIQQTDYMDMPGSANYIRAADSTGLSITGDIDLRVRVALDDWTPATVNQLVTKWINSVSPTQQSFRFSVQNSSGRLALDLSSSGSNTLTATSSASPTVSDGATLWVRVTWRASDGRTQFFTASGATTTPVAADFTQLGTNLTLNAAGTIYDSTADINIGAYNSGATNPAAGNFYRVQIRNGIDGTLVADWSAPKVFQPQHGTVYYDYLRAIDLNAIGGPTFYGGSHSVDSSNNSGFT